MTRRSLRCAWLAALALQACVQVDDGRSDRDEAMAGLGAQGGEGGTAGSSGPGGVGGAGGSSGSHGGSGGLDPENPSAGSGGGGLPAPNVDAIFETGCAMATAKAELPPVNLLFVLDRSQSMECNTPAITSSAACEERPVREDPEQSSKWEITREALKHMVHALPPQTVVGISYFSNDDACGVSSRPRIPLRPLVPAQVAAIEASLLNVTPNGATPLVGATILAYRHLHEAALDGTIRGERFVVLLTDGEQSEMCFDEAHCTDKQSCTDLLINEEVGKASGPGVGIRTFVIGVPGSEPAREVLSTIAVEGGTAPEGCEPGSGECHFDMSEELDLGAALSGALDQIVGRALSCELPLPTGTEEVDRDRVNVVYSPASGTAPRVFPRDDTKGCNEGASGWQYAANGSSIRLCGSACEEARNDSGGRIDVVLGCPVQGPE